MSAQAGFFDAFGPSGVVGTAREDDAIALGGTTPAHAATHDSIFASGGDDPKKAANPREKNMLTFLSASTVASPPTLLPAGATSSCTSVTARDELSSWCASSLRPTKPQASCQEGFCLVPGGWKCTCTSSIVPPKLAARPSTALLPVHKGRERLLGEGSDGSGASPLTPSCETLAELDPEHTLSRETLLAGGWELARAHPRKTVSFLGCALETARKPTQADHQPVKDVKHRDLLACPLNIPNASGASDEVLSLHRTMLEAGFLRLDGSNSAMADPRLASRARGAGNHETRLWPRPAVCATHPGSRVDLKEFIGREQLSKLVNKRRQLEYRPVLKGGSTMMRHLLPCLQPGQWEEVPQATAVRAGSTLLVLQRAPISRFASALVEVMERTFRQQCPEGPCSKERDGYYDTVTPGLVKNATTWYGAAEELLAAHGKGLTDDALLTKLISAAALDASCNLKYYASMHFASQTGLLMQGTTPPETPARFFDLETLGGDLDAVLASDLVRLVLRHRSPPSRAALETCLGQERTARVNVALQSLSRRRRPRRRLRLNTAGAGDGDLPQNHHDDRLLPSSSDIVEAIESDPPTKLLLEAMFGMDRACTAPRPRAPP